MLLYDAFGRKLAPAPRFRRVIGFFVEYREVEEISHEAELADAVAAVDGFALEDPFSALEEC